MQQEPNSKMIISYSLKIITRKKMTALPTPKLKIKLLLTPTSGKKHHCKYMISTLVQIFGGCCSNVLTLESITNNIKNSGHLITFFQFAFVALIGCSDAFDFSSAKLKKTVIPIYHWMGIVFFFWSSSLLNNMALDYKISMRILLLINCSISHHF